MIGTVEIEKYFQKNIKQIKLENGISMVAWKNGSLVDCRGEEQAFEKDNDEIIRKGEYDYVVNRKKNKKSAIIFASDLENVVTQNAMSNVAKKTAKELEKRSFKKIVSEKVIYQ